MYAKVENQQIVKYPYTLADLQKDHPNTSFASDMAEQHLLEFGMIPVKATEQPAVDHTKNIVETNPVYIEGEWHQSWTVEDAIAGEIEVRIERRAAEMRSHRTRLLNESVDTINAVRWAVMPEETKSAWITYRQDLLDVPQQQGFPWSVTWPQRPE